MAAVLPFPRLPLSLFPAGLGEAPGWARRPPGELRGGQREEGARGVFVLRGVLSTGRCGSGAGGADTLGQAEGAPGRAAPDKEREQLGPAGEKVDVWNASGSLL